MEQQFIESFAMQFNQADPSMFSANTEFKKLEEWSSLLALSIISMVDEDFGVRLKGEDIRSSTTISELYNIVKSKM